LAKRCLQISREWAKERVQWGAPIGKHSAIADKIAQMAANVFAMESMTHYAASLVDRDKSIDIRLEAAMCKMWASEKTWEIVDDTMQIRGGRGYETAASLAARGEKPIAVERMMRDARINMIFEGSSEIMRLFIAREALDPHLKIGGPVLNSKVPMPARCGAAARAAVHYARWYPGLFMPKGAPSLPHARYVSATARRLARSLFHSMIRFGPKLEKQQILLGRFVDIGAELFAMASASARAASLNDQAAIDLAREFGAMARVALRECFARSDPIPIAENYRLAQRVGEGDFNWLDEGML
jgi:alkylation response protein AidB-like acyl-CoA dehydrogenase